MEGLSRVGIFSENIELQNILNLIGKSLSNIGRYKKIVTKQERKVFTNLTELINGGSDFESMRKLDLGINYENIMVDLQKYLSKLIDFYSELINSSNPYFEDTNFF